METREIYNSVWKHLLWGTFAILFGGALLLLSHGDTSDWRAQYVIPVCGWLFLLGGIFLFIMSTWQRLAHSPSLRLTDESLEVYAGIGKGYERYPWKLINAWGREKVSHQDFIVLIMDDSFRPTVINPYGAAARWTTNMVGSPYVIPCSLLPYKYDELERIIHSYWEKHTNEKA